MLVWVAGARRPEVEEALWPLDGHRTVTGVLTKLTKPSVPVNLVGPQVSHPPRRVAASRGSIHFLCIIRRHFRWLRAESGGNAFFAKYGGPSGGYQQSGGKCFFREIRWPVRRVPAVRWRNNYFAHNKRHFLAAAMDPAVSLSIYSTLPMEVVPWPR